MYDYEEPRRTKWYAVARGRETGIFTDWDYVQSLVHGYSFSKYKWFNSREGAQRYLDEHERQEWLQSNTHPFEPDFAPAPNVGMDTGLESEASVRAVFGFQPSPNCSYRLDFDGASRGNPGNAAAGMSIYVDESGYEEIAAGMQYLGDYRTNNEAEYCGLILGLEVAFDLGIRSIHVYGDSQLVINQLLGHNQVRSARLIPLHEEASRLLNHFQDVTLNHVSREQNARADYLANLALDEQ